ncbi:MAG: HNH endonuclease [Myxococcota bacterium]
MGLALLVSDVRRAGVYERSKPGAGGWESVHERVVSFAKRRAGLEWEEGRLLCEALRAGVHRRLGFASFSEYVGRLFGYNGRLVKEKLRVGQALEPLREMSDALRTGELTWSAVRELTRVATAETERAWLDAARGQTVRQVEELVSGRAPGDLPSDAADPALRLYELRHQVHGETRALWLEALAKLRRDAGEALDDDAMLLLMARRILADEGEAKSDAGRASYQVQVTTCKSCGRSEQIGGGERHALAPEVAEMTQCDAQVIPDAETARCDAQVIPDAAATHAAATHVRQASAATQVSQRASAATQVSQRASQTIPPAVRRQVMRRDNGRCVVNGCKHATFVDAHHLKPRSEGGRHEPDNLVCLCAAHHRAVHQGRLVIEGQPSTGLTFKHADGTQYGGALLVGAADRNAQVFAALRGMGFKERECRTALDRCAATIAPNATREAMLRAALQVLTT